MIRLAITAAAIVVLMGTIYTAHREGYNAGADAVRAEWQAAQAEADAQARKTEQDLTDAREKHATKVASMQAALDRARADADAQRVRSAAQAAADRARQACTGQATASVGSAAGDPIGVLADVLARADERAGLLADLADRRYIAGRACEVEYETLRKSVLQ